MISEYWADKFCNEAPSKIENYDKAISDNTQTWHCHHRRETIYTRQELIDIGEYYNRPACELIFLPKSEHMSLHRKVDGVGKHHSEETKRKIGKKSSIRMRGNKIWLGKHHSEETKRKISELKKGKYAGENNPNYGKHYSEETKRKISESKKGRYWWNNGSKCVCSKECPGEGWVKGRIGWKNNKENIQ